MPMSAVLLDLAVFLVRSRARPEKSVCRAVRSGERRYVAVLLYAKTAGLTIYGFCC